MRQERLHVVDDKAWASAFFKGFSEFTGTLMYTILCLIVGMFLANFMGLEHQKKL